MEVLEKDPMLYKIVRPLAKAIFKVLYRPTIIGAENIPKEGAVVLAGNHTSNLDWSLLLSSTKRCIHFLAKKELFKGIMKPIFTGAGLIPVNRKTKDGKALESAINVLNKGMVVGIFPEGTINKTDDVVMPFKIGAVKMAHDTNTKIVPFVIKGKFRLFRKGVRIVFFKPMKMNDDVLDNSNKRLVDFISDKLIDRKV